MFRKLRNKLIWINLGITTAVIIVAFTGIYISATRSASSRPPMDEDRVGLYSADIERVVQASIEEEKAAAAADLMRNLIISGVLIEASVALVSYFLAEESMRPVKEAYEAQKIFIANASHEIKTPLAAISANLEAAEITDNPWIDNVARETEKLTELNHELLTLAQADLQSAQKTEDVAVSEVVKETIKNFAPRLKSLKVTQEIAKTKKMQINREDLERILSILLDNAIKYGEKKIQIDADEKKIIVANDGAKIAAEDLPHIFERFYQTDKSAEGVGLGLAIAKSLAERSGWKLTAKSDEKMTQFVLEF